MLWDKSSFIISEQFYYPLSSAGQGRTFTIELHIFEPQFCPKRHFLHIYSGKHFLHFLQVSGGDSSFALRSGSTKELRFQFRFGATQPYAVRPPPFLINFEGVNPLSDQFLHLFYTIDQSVPVVEVRDIYKLYVCSNSKLKRSFSNLQLFF